MSTGETAILDEAYERLHATGAEFDGWLSNHGPMAAEAMVRRGHATEVPRWLDWYMARLEELPGRVGPIGHEWKDAIGDPRRVTDWTDHFRHELAELVWPSVLSTWWPRLLPGVAAAATHGVIRVGHAVRALLEDGEDGLHLDELAHGLAYWALPARAGSCHRRDGRHRRGAGHRRRQAPARRASRGGAAHRRSVGRRPRTARPPRRAGRLAGIPVVGSRSDLG